MITIEHKNLLDPQARWEQIEASHEVAVAYKDQEQARAVAITLTQRWSGKQMFRICDESGQVVETYAVKPLFLVWTESGVPSLSLMAPDGTVPLDALSSWPTISENETTAWRADQRIDVTALAQGYCVSMEEILDIIVQLKVLARVTNGDIEDEIVGIDPSQEMGVASAQQAELVQWREGGGMPDASPSEHAGNSVEGSPTGRAEQPREHIRHGQALREGPPVTPLMTPDPFQNAYHGQVEIKTGTKKRPKTEERVIGVIREVYEAERDQVGAIVEDPDYWLKKLNWMSVYLVEELKQMMEVAWILGDYDPISSRVPAGIKATPEQIAAYLSAGVDGEEWAIRVIKKHLRTPEQQAWLAAQDYTLEDVLNGRTSGDPEIQAMFDDWNAKLGVKEFGF